MQNLREYLKAENFKYTSWANSSNLADTGLIQKSSKKKNEETPSPMEDKMKKLLQCCSCSKFLTSAQLQRMNDQSQDQSCPLEICQKCHQLGESSYIFCLDCREQKKKCVLNHALNWNNRRYGSNQTKPLNEALFQMISRVKYRCMYCPNDHNFYNPIELESHFIKECPNILKKIEKESKIKPNKCNDCGKYKLDDHSCRKGKVSGMQLMKNQLVDPCSKHKHINFNSIPMQRMVGIDDKLKYTRVYFEAFKCHICENLPMEFINCKKCDTIYCSQCTSNYESKRYALMSEMKESCVVCLEPFKDESKTCIFDRNLNSIICQDLKMECQFAEMDGCTMKSGSHERIIAHQ